jgi:hypothetical protein
MLMSHNQKTWQKHSTELVNRSFEDVTKFKYLGTTLTDQNCTHEEIKSRLNMGNASYHLVQSLLSSHLLSRNVKVKIYKTIILPVVLWGCLRTGCWRVLGPKRDEVKEEYRKLHSGKLHNLYSLLDIISQIKSRRMRWAGHAAHMKKKEKCTRFRWGSLN